jgi:hypothetical protein
LKATRFTNGFGTLDPKQDNSIPLQDNATLGRLRKRVSLRTAVEMERNVAQ